MQKDAEGKGEAQTGLGRLLIIEDHALVREGLRLMTEEMAQFGTVREAGSLTAALTELQATDEPPALVILDLGLPDTDAQSALRAMQKHCPETPVLVVSGSDDPRLINEAFALGARGYLPKHSSPRTLRNAIEVVVSGDMYVPPAVLPSHAQAQRMGARASDAGPAPRLTPRQCDVLLRLARGLSNKEIAAELDLSQSTVRVHISALLKLLGVENRTQAATSAEARRLLGAGD